MMRIVSFTDARNGLKSVLDNVVNAAHLSRSIEQF